jgi:ferrous-iron efflux pump FieF
MNQQSQTVSAQAVGGSEQHGRLMTLAAVSSVAVASVLIVAKLGAWIATDSVALLSTLLDSVLDVAASLVNLFAVRRALVPPDREHRFGHGKAEPLAALAQAAFICGSAVFLLFEAGQRLVTPRPVEQTGIGIAVMLLAIVLTLALVALQRRVISRTGSVAIRADSLHYVGDLLINCTVILALLLSKHLGWTWADPIFAIAIAAYLVKIAVEIAGSSFDMLMDRELPDAAREQIVQIVRAHPEVIGMHDLRTRGAGPTTFIQLHLEMDGGMTLWQAHAIADAVEKELRRAFPGAEVLIHEDPYGVAERRASFTP